MFYQEIKPGIFVSNEQKVHYALDECPYCGSSNALSHHKYTERCIDCGNLYNLYSVRRNQRINGKLTLKTAEAHLALLMDLASRSLKGLRVPATLTEELEETTKIVDKLSALSKPTTERGECRCCGITTDCTRDKRGTLRCLNCVEVLRRYKYLYHNIPILDFDGCNELSDIIFEYIRLEKMGYLVPYVKKAIPKLQQRIVELGGERKIFYRMGAYSK